MHTLIEQLAAARNPIGAPFMLVAGAPAVPVAAAHHENSSDASLARQPMRFGNGWVISVIETGLKRALRSRRGRHERCGFLRRTRQRLFAQHMLSGFKRRLRD